VWLAVQVIMKSLYPVQQRDIVYLRVLKRFANGVIACGVHGVPDYIPSIHVSRPPRRNAGQRAANAAQRAAARPAASSRMRASPRRTASPCGPTGVGSLGSSMRALQARVRVYVYAYACACARACEAAGVGVLHCARVCVCVPL
jgi:hypothetical protein